MKQAAVIVRRRHAAANALAAAAIILLAIDPLEAFTAGFQLSFAIVGGLILLHRSVRRLLFGPLLHRVIAPPTSRLLPHE